MFQVNATRSRQKLSMANFATARSMSRTASAASKSASQASTRSCGVTSVVVWGRVSEVM